MHNAPLRKIIGVGIVLRHPVIPNSHVVRLPAPAYLELWFGDMGKQETQQRLALFLADVHNSGSETFIHKQRLLTAHRMRAHHRMQQRRVLRHRLQPALMLFFRFPVLIFLE